MFLAVVLSLVLALSVHFVDYLLSAVAGVVALVAAVFLGWMIRGLVRSYVQNRGTRVVTCPETENFVAVKLDAGHAAATGLFGDTHLRLERCTRWPERQDCPQECIKQIQEAPDGCRLQAMLSAWYLTRKCTFCRRAFGEIRWFDHEPALLSPGGRIREWETIPPQEIPRMLASHWPVCWNCKVVETFRSEHADLVVERPRR
jgi:hypothetical protein